MKKDKTFRPDRIASYFRVEWLPLAVVTLSGLIYNVGLLAGPWFEGRLAQCLADILGGSETAARMAVLVLAYILVTLTVQAARFVKRFYVRRFANNINRRMKGILYANLVRRSCVSLEREGAGELMTKAISDVDDCVEGMRKFTTEVFDTGVALLGYTAMERTNFYDAIYSPVVLLLNAVVVGVVMLLSASGNTKILTLFGMSVGTSVAVIDYISRIFAPIESLGMEIQTIQSAMAGVKRIDAFLGQPERILPGAREKETRGDVALSHVTFGYGEKPVLRDFSMSVRQGEQVTLIGRTGAGKSTVFKLLLGLYQPEAGTVTIGGVDVSTISDRERRRCIGCVEQHFSRVPGTVLDQITLGDPQITEEMAKNAARLAGIEAAVQSLPEGYDTVCTEGMFSQGEWQLLSIARAAAADPAVLLLDEITANLDAETETRVLEALCRASEGRTVLSVSHRIYESLGGRTIEIKTPCGECR